MKTIQIIVSGRVQGVYYRAFTKKLANKYNVMGFSRNKLDGSVEILACAEPENLKEFIAGCYKGPLLARVSQVLVHTTNPENFTQFEIR